MQVECRKLERFSASNLEEELLKAAITTALY